MNTTLLVTWLLRYGHVAAGAMWLGGYLVLAFVMIPALARERDERLEHLTHFTVRVLTYVGTATLFFGMLLVTRTRGYGVLLEGEWGTIIILCFILTIVLLGIGDGALRPAIRRMKDTGDIRPARRLALLGFGLTVLRGRADDEGALRSFLSNL